MPKGEIVGKFGLYLSLMSKVFMNDKGIISGYGGRLEVASIQDNKGITLLQVAVCKMNDKQINL